MHHGISEVGCEWRLDLERDGHNALRVGEVVGLRI